MDINKCRIDMKVRTLSGHEGAIVEINKDGMIRVDFGANNYHYVPFHAANVEPIAPEACESCQHIAILRKDRDNWKAIAEAAARNAKYWREELSKLQKEALAECKPLGEVAKIYIQISPSVLAKIMADREE
jgi:hypothetical protein